MKNRFHKNSVTPGATAVRIIAVSDPHLGKIFQPLFESHSHSEWRSIFEQEFTKSQWAAVVWAKAMWGHNDSTLDDPFALAMSMNKRHRRAVAAAFADWLGVSL